MSRRLATYPINDVRIHQIYEHHTGEPILITTAPYINNDILWAGVMGIGGGTRVINETVDYIKGQKLIGLLGLTHDLTAGGIVKKPTPNNGYDILDVFEFEQGLAILIFTTPDGEPCTFFDGVDTFNYKEGMKLEKVGTIGVNFEIVAGKGE